MFGWSEDERSSSFPTNVEEMWEKIKVKCAGSRYIWKHVWPKTTTSSISWWQWVNFASLPLPLDLPWEQYSSFGQQFFFVSLCGSLKKNHDIGNLWKKAERLRRLLIRGQKWEQQKQLCQATRRGGQTLLGLTFFRLFSSSSSWRILTSLEVNSSFSRRSSSCCLKNIRSSCTQKKKSPQCHLRETIIWNTRFVFLSNIWWNSLLALSS